MIRLLIPCLFLVGCRSCAERRAERAYEDRVDEITTYLDGLGLSVEIQASQEVRDDGASEAWGTGATDGLYAPAPEWVLQIGASEPDWWDEYAHGCVNDVPMVSTNVMWTEIQEATDDYGVAYSLLAGGCLKSGDDLTGAYEAGIVVDITAFWDDPNDDLNPSGVPYDLPIEVELTIE